MLGGSEGCYAKVKAIKYKVGNKVFTYIKKRPQKRVAAGEIWKLSFPISGAFKAIVVRALRANKTVLGKLTADLDATPADIVVRVK